MHPIAMMPERSSFVCVFRSDLGSNPQLTAAALGATKHSASQKLRRGLSVFSESWYRMMGTRTFCGHGSVVIASWTRCEPTSTAAVISGLVRAHTQEAATARTSTSIHISWAVTWSC